MFPRNGSVNPCPGNKVFFQPKKITTLTLMQRACALGNVQHCNKTGHRSKKRLELDPLKSSPYYHHA